MLCVKCQTFYSFAEFLNFKTGKLNKTCSICLGTKHAQIGKIVILDNFSDIDFQDLFPEAIVIISDSQDFEYIDLKELFNDLNNECFEKTGYKFRITQITENHIYSKCRYSDKIQATEVTDRKRKNFGKEKFNCCGILYIHRNLNYFSIFFKHIIAHQEYLDVCVNGEILDEIKEKARLMTPSQIYKQLLSANHDNEKMRNITISQIR